MDSSLLNTDTLAGVGIKLLPKEELEIAVELEDGVTEQLEQVSRNPDSYRQEAHTLLDDRSFQQRSQRRTE